MAQHPIPSLIYDLPRYDPRRSLGYLISQVRCELTWALDAELASDDDLAAFELSAAQFVILATLATEEAGKAVSITDLCKRATYDAGGMTRMLDRLEVKGLIHRRRCTADRRVIYVELTGQGKAAFPRMREISVGVLNRLLRGFTKIEARQLEGYLTRILQNAHVGRDANE